MLSSRGPISERSHRPKSRGKVVFEDDVGYESFGLHESISTEADQRKMRGSAGSGSGMLRSSRTNLGSGTKLANYELFSPSTAGSLVKSIVNRKNTEYEGEKYVECFDELLEKSYNIVSQRQQQKEHLKTEQDDLERKVLQANKDVLPEIKRSKILKETLREAQGVQAKHERDIELLDSKINKLRELIEISKLEHKIKEDKMVENIQRIGEEVEVITHQKALYKRRKEEEVVNLDRRLDDAYEEERVLMTEIADTKKRVINTKGQLQRKQLAMEEKSRAFFGMLHHYNK